MKFKPGDFVVCNEVIQFLDYGKVYTVSAVTRDADGPNHQQLILQGEPGWYDSSRFRIPDERDHLKPTGKTISASFGSPVTLRDKVAEYSTDYTISDIGTVKASKNDSDKIDLSLIPAIALKEEAKAFMVGEKKYGRYNYTKGHKASQLVAAAMRHLTAWNEGEECDPIDGQHHLGSVRACCAMIIRQMELGTLTDDRFKK